MGTNTSQNRPVTPASSLPAFFAVLAMATVVAAVVTTAVLVLVDRLDRPSQTVSSPAGMPTIVAQVGGAVATPGVYPLPAGGRLDDLVTRAGGLAPDADVADLNLAARVGDGERVVIPSVERATPAPTEPAEANPPLLVNVNTASIEELDRLPGIGPAIGERIVHYREQNGPFTSLDELTRVDGISARMVERLRPLVTLDD